MKMTREIFNVICAVVDYKRWINSDVQLKGRSKDNFDWYEKTWNYYLNINKPEEMRNNNSDFDRVLFYSTTKEGSELLKRMYKAENAELEDCYSWK